MNINCLGGIRPLLFGAILTIVASPAIAGGYMGFGLGMSKIDDSNADLSDLGLGLAVNVDDSDTAFKLFGGFNVNPNFAFEFGYADLGEFTTTAAGSGFDPVAGNYSINASQTTEIWALFAAALGKIPLSEHFDLFGKLGFARWDLNISGDATATSDVYGTERFSASGGDDGFNPVLGAGFHFAATEHFLIRFEWERFIDVGEGANFEGLQLEGSDIDTFGLAAIYRF